jgi:hypothetical protein
MEETTTFEQPSWFQDAMKKGLILGIIHLMLFMIVYMLFPSKLTGFSYLFVIISVNIGYCIYQGIQWRKQNGGYIEFGPAFKYVFIILAFNGLVGILFNLLFLFIDPGFPEMMAQSQLDTSTYWASKMGAPEEVIEKMRDDFKPEDVTKRYTLAGIPMSILFLSIFYVIGATIITFFVRRRKPDF